MGEVVSFPTSLEDNHDFISDMARFADGLLSEAAIRKKYRVGADVWEALGENDALVEKIEAEKTRRIRCGDTKRERAQQLITKAPGILDSIMTDPAASPRHRVDAIKTLDTFTANTPESAPASDRFVITINLGSDVLHFDKSKMIDATDIDPNDTAARAQDVIAAIAVKKPTEGGNGNAL
jgi:hypothetical protein